MKPILWAVLLAAVLQGCASMGAPLETPPEFKQKVILAVDDDYTMYQAPRSGYDVGDLQNFHSQHTFSMLVEESFKEIFSQVEMQKSEAGIETAEPDVPAVFEVKMLDLANDIYNEADSYRAETTIAVAMASPSGKVLWQESFRGDGYVNVDPQFSNNLGPQDAVVDAVADALDQMQKAIINSPAVRGQLKYYAQAKQAKEGTELTV